MSARNKLAWNVMALFLVCGSAVAQDVGGGMLDPALDTPGEPFSYFWHPTDVIGALFAPVASELGPMVLQYEVSRSPEPGASGGER